MITVEKTVSKAVESTDTYTLKEFKDMEGADGKTVSVLSTTRTVRRDDIVREIEQSDNQIKSIQEQKAKNVAILADIDELTA